MEQRCIGTISKDWVKALDVETTYQDLKDDDRPKKKRLKLESLCDKYSAEVERSLLQGAVVKASYDLALEVRMSSAWYEEYGHLEQSACSYESRMKYP